MFKNVTDHGVLPDGKTDNTAALQSLLNDFGRGLGGTLYFPAGQYVIGSLELKSNTTLYLDAGATLLASDCFDLFPPITESELSGFTRHTRRGVLFALNGKNITVNGGTPA